MIEKTNDCIERAYWCRIAAVKLIVFAQKEMK